MKQLNNNVLNIIKTRNPNSHKGSFGKVLMIAGSTHYAGAAIMSSSAAVYAGAGLVTLATDPSVYTAVNVATPEVMTIDYNQDFSEALNKAHVVAIGPGLEKSFTNDSLKNLIQNLTVDQTLIIDATALNTLAENISILKESKAKIILTPHQKEWERLSSIKITEQTPDNNQAFIKKLPTNPIVILKSHKTQIYYQNMLYQNIPGNPGMATGGSGDTLTGIIASFCAQFGNNIDVINAAIYAHSDLANQLYDKNYVVLPEVLIKYLPKYMKKAAH